jgi:pimeloyl-ACP methyl ester carboxylesterase
VDVPTHPPSLRLVDPSVPRDAARRLPHEDPIVTVQHPDPHAAGPSPRWPGDRGGHVWPKDREAVTDDGVRVRYTVRGPEDGSWVVLCSGFMCPDNFWSGLGAELMRRHRVVVLNYRSVGASSDPRPPGWRARNLRAEDYTIERMAADVAAVLDAEDAREVVPIGHSMGCQVALQLWRARPDLVDALALVTGPYASPLHTFYGSKLGVYLFPFAERGLPLLPRPVQRLIVRAPRLPIAMPVARMIRALGPETPPEDMAGYLRHFGEVDPMVALKIAQGMHRFDSRAWVHEVDVPSLVVVGSDDTFSPPQIGEQLLSAMPDVELVTVRGGTHAALIEYPYEVHDAVADFLHRRLGGPAAPRLGRASVLHGPVTQPDEARPA